MANTTTNNGGTSTSTSTTNDASKATAAIDLNTASPTKLSPKLKFQAAAFAVKSSNANKAATTKATAATTSAKIYDVDNPLESVSAAFTNAKVGENAVSSKSKFQAAAFAVKTSNKANKVNKAGGRGTNATEAARILESLSAEFTNEKISENVVSSKSKFQAAAFAVKNLNANKASEVARTAMSEATKAITGTTTTGTGNGNNNSNNNSSSEETATKDATNDGNNNDPAIDNWAKLAYAAKITALAAKNARVKQQEKLFNRCVVQATTWDVWSP
jgi:hypothetical protein